MIEQLLAVLAEVGVEADAEEISDALWLARARREESEFSHRQLAAAMRSAPTEPRPPDAEPHPVDSAQAASGRASSRGRERPAAAGQDASSPGTAATSITLRKARALSGALELARALRPLKQRHTSKRDRVLDAEATVEYFCDTGVLTPVMRPGAERWFDVDVVVDTGPSMAVWQDTVGGLVSLLERHGAFRAVRRWALEQVDGKVRLSRHGGARSEAPQLVDPDARRLTMVVTDCIGSMWYQAPVWDAIAAWGLFSPVAIMAMLPPRLWPQTALGSPEVRMRTHRPGAANRSLDVALPWWWPDDDPSRLSVPVPVITLEAGSVSRWAHMVMGVGGVETSGVFAMPPATTVAVRHGDGPPDVEKRVQRFRVTVSPVAYRLAVYLAAALRGRWGLTLARVIQEAMLPDSGQLHLAEVIIGGLVRRADQRAGDEQLMYEFIDGVANVLQRSLTGTEALQVLQALGTYIERETGHSPGIAAMLLGEDLPADTTREFDDVCAGAANLIQVMGLSGAGVVPRQAAQAPSTSVVGDQAANLREAEPQGERVGDADRARLWQAPVVESSAEKDLLNATPASVPLADRVVEVIADLGEAASSRYRYGSGCIVGGQTVLTAAYVVKGAISVKVRDPGKVTHEAALNPEFIGDVSGPGPDLALLEVAGLELAFPAMGLAAIHRDSVSGGPVERCHVIGYPAFMERDAPGGRFRETVDAFGQVPVLSGLAGGLLSVQVSSASRALPAERTTLGESEWSGMSGAPVIAERLLLGVVTEHAPRTGPSAITATPLTALDADPTDPSRGPGVANPSAWWARLGRTGAGALRRLPPAPYWATVREIHQRTRTLIGREAELAEIAAFATGTEGYQWLTGGRWTGKTSLLAEAVMALQGQCDVVSYFLSRREADADSSRFLAAVVPQLAYRLGEDPPGAELQQFRALWHRAVQSADAEGRHLLLVVDGLDEDLRPPGMPSVAALLPQLAGGHAHVLVASRPYLELPADVPPGHLLRGAPQVELTPFPGAEELTSLTGREIDDVLRMDDGGLATDVLGLLAAAAGPLAINDLATLTTAQTAQIRRVVTRQAARSLVAVGSDQSPRYQFAHVSLLEQAQRNKVLSDPDFRRRIERWADQWRDAGWPAPGGEEGTTPLYLLDSYPSTLANQPTRLAALASDVGWVATAVQTLSVDATLTILDAANSAGAVSTEVSALLAILRAQAPNLRPPQPVDQAGYVLRQLATQAAELGEDRLAADARARLRVLPGYHPDQEPPAPVVTGLSPASGPVAGGLTVMVTGREFTGVTGVNFGKVAAANVTVSSDTQLLVTSPPGAAGTVEVRVISPAGTSATTPADLYTYVATDAAPAVMGISPASGSVAGGGSVMVTGSGFAGATEVIFSRIAATDLTVSSDTQLTVTSPPGAAGTVEVRVISPAGYSATTPADRYTYVGDVASDVMSVSSASWSVEDEIQLRQKVDNATAQSGLDDLLDVIGDIDDPEVPVRARQVLGLEVAIALRERGASAKAADLLAGVPAPSNTLRVQWLQVYAMALRRQGEDMARKGGDPEPFWQEAQRLLDAALVIDKDPETRGIAGGLAKQRGVRELVAGRYDLGRAHLQRAADLYLEGAEAEPANFYVGLNAVTTLRILAQHLGGDQEQLEQARALLPVVLYFAANAVKRNPGDFWAVVSVAELVLTAHLLGGTETEEDVIRAYARAATMRPRPDYLTSVVNQLRLYRHVGDPASLIDRIVALFEMG